MTASRKLMILCGIVSGVAVFPHWGIPDDDAARSRVERSGTTRKLTFNKDIAPLLYGHCIACHRAGQPAPISLETYEDVAKRARQIALVTRSRLMPPWKPKPGYGEFRHMRRLRDEEIAKISRWVAEGAPRGEAKDLPSLPRFQSSWQLGTPNLVLRMPTPFAIPSDGSELIRCVVIPPGWWSTRSLSAYEFHPGNPASVHHVLLYLSRTPTDRPLDVNDQGSGDACFSLMPGMFSDVELVGGWVAGTQARRWPEDIGKPIGQGRGLVAEIHYRPTGKPERDDSMLGLYFAKKPIRRRVVALPLRSVEIQIPAGEPRHRVAASFITPVDLEVLSVWPHMHYLGREMKLTAIRPDGTVQPMLWIQDWDPSWQEHYEYESFVKLPKGTRLEMEASYDNSVNNPRNPHSPPQPVHFGQRTTDEMALCALEVVAEQDQDLSELFEALKVQHLNF